MTDGVDRRRRRNWASVAVAVGITILGVSSLAGITYANATTSVSDDYEQFSQECEDLDGKTRLVDGGLGMEEQQLDQRHVEACKNTTYAEYRKGRLESMQTTPLNLKQWVLYGGTGTGLATIGVIILRQELASE